MNRQIGLILTIVTALVCGGAGLIFCCAGLFISTIGLSADSAQFKLDTGLEPSSVLPVGLGGICSGLILVIIPLAVWFFTMRRSKR